MFLVSVFAVFANGEQSLGWRMLILATNWDRISIFLFFSADHITRSGVNSRETDILEAGWLPERE